MVMHGFGRSARSRDGRWRLPAPARWLAAICLVALAGCASMGGVTKDSPPEAKRALVSERVKARWAALIEGNLDKAYTFLSPASRELVSLEAYKRVARGTGFREAVIEKVECPGAVCDVELRITYDHRLMKGIVTPLAEKWVIEEGQAWYVWQQ
jgi:hypothetical protein